MTKTEEMAAIVHASEPAGYPTLESARTILLAAGYVQADFDETQSRPPSPSEEAPISEIDVDGVLLRVVKRVRAMRGPFSHL